MASLSHGLDQEWVADLQQTMGSQTTDYLEQILKDESYPPEMKEAARRVLEERRRMKSLQKENVC
jgi:hypothetical protein